MIGEHRCSVVGCGTWAKGRYKIKVLAGMLDVYLCEQCLLVMQGGGVIA